MRRVAHLYQTSIGKKIAMALTGLILVGFVFIHMIGNLKIYQGPEKFNAYAEFLREVGYPVFGHEQALWIARLVLLAVVVVHMLMVLQLWLQSRRARLQGYKVVDDLSFSYASGTMRWGGLVVIAFVIYHILHLTLGTVHPSFEPGEAYQNVVAGFSVWPVSAFYILAMLPLGLHLYHGLWSITQTLAIQNPTVKKWRRPAAAVVAVVIVLGNISIPLSVLTGVVR